jgi:glycosyltransferase involved in cell wall biosynthesis
VRLVFVTQQVDPAHPNLGATVPKLRALAALVDEVVVLADSAAPDALPANCRVATFGAPSRAGRGLRFAAALARELARRPRPAAVVAHMCPIYAVLAAPLARPLGSRVLLWYTHWNRTRTLRAAARLADVVLSVDRRSFPLPSSKLVPIGHGIDMAQFTCRDGASAAPLRVAVLGRYSTAKGLPTVVRAVASIPGARLDVHGPALTAAERTHQRELEALVAELGAAARVTLGGPVPRGRVPALLAAADVVVNNMRAGAADKIVLEAAASCVPVLASDPGWAETLDGLELPLRFAREDPGDLAGRLEALSAAGSDVRARIGRELRARVEERHSVESWARGVLAAAT